MTKFFNLAHKIGMKTRSTKYRSSCPMIEDITVTARHRDVDPKKVQAIAESIRDVGLLHPIIVTYPDDCTVELVAGRHRLEAARSLGWKYIDAINAVELNSLQREMIEIDENLCRVELSPAEEAAAVVRRKAIYEELHPETKQGGNQGQDGKFKPSRQNGDTAERFTADTAAKTGKSERTVQRTVERGEKIGQDNLRKVTGTSLDKPGELDALAKIKDPVARDDLIDRASAGQKISAKRDQPNKKPERVPTEIEALRERAGKLGYKIRKRGASYHIIRDDGTTVLSTVGIDTDTIGTLHLDLDGLEGNTPWQMHTACGMRIEGANNSKVWLAAHPGATIEDFERALPPLQPSEDADASAEKRKAEYAAADGSQIEATNKFCRELGDIMQRFVPRFRAWFHSTEHPEEGKRALHNYLMETANELMTLAQEVDGRGTAAPDAEAA